ncbi:MAG: hypothetical protein ACI88A_003639 [Paraglaciecola sp.]|jgi:uncharacterized protein (DUF885 family)
MTIKFLLLSCLILLSCRSFADEKITFNHLLDEIWEYELSVSPRRATRLGEHKYDHLLEDLSAQSFAAQDTQFRQYLSRLNNWDQLNLDRQQQISLLMQVRKLQNFIDQYAFNAHFMPLTSESGFHSSLAFLPKSTRFKSLEDYQNYLARLEQFPRYFAQQISWMKEGLKIGFVQPKVVLQGFEKSIESFINKTPEESSFYAPFKKIAELKLDEHQQHDLLVQAKKVIQQSVFPAYQNFYDFMVKQYIPNSKSDVAAKSWPNGEAYYNNRSHYYTTTDMSTYDIHQLGLSEVKRIRAQMQQVVDELEFDGDINQFIHYLRTDSKFYAETPEELLKQAAYIAKKIDAKLPQLFYKMPRTPYGVAPVPANIAAKYTTGRYISPTRNDQPGYYWVNTYALDKRPLYALTALTLHEAVPGHHLQISLASEMQDLPAMRRHTYISAFGEGWGLYAEFLGKEVGMYSDPYDEFGRLSYEMWRACRLVVDTGMHMLGWSRQRALDYMLENTALSEHNVKTEVDRYISWPGQALSYKIGELTIKKLRKQAEEELGDKFDLRAFHDALLEYGSIPLSVLETNIDDFIESQR